MLSPSTAPRWNTPTRTLPRAAAALAARARKAGGVASAASTQPVSRSRTRRVSIVIASLSAPLELGGPEHQSRELRHVGIRGAAVVPRAPDDLGLVQLGGQHRARLLAGPAVQDRAQEGLQDGVRPPAVGV